MIEASKRIRFGRAVVDIVTKGEVLVRAERFLFAKSEPPAVIATVNAQFVHLAGQQRRFANFLERADLSIADGMSLVFGSHLLGKPLPERITGIDLTNDLCELLNRHRGSVYLLGGKPGAQSSAAKILLTHYPKLRIAGVNCPPMGFEKIPEVAATVLEMIQVAKPDLLLVGFGAPKQEYWIEDNLATFPCKLVMGVGCTFDILSGQVRRAPHWIQACGLEWFFRVCTEPRRLWKRYLLGNSYFIGVVLKQGIAQILHIGDRQEAEVGH